MSLVFVSCRSHASRRALAFVTLLFPFRCLFFDDLSDLTAMAEPASSASSSSSLPGARAHANLLTQPVASFAPVGQPRPHASIGIVTWNVKELGWHRSDVDLHAAGQSVGHLPVDLIFLQEVMAPPAVMQYPDGRERPPALSSSAFLHGVWTQQAHFLCDTSPMKTGYSKEMDEPGKMGKGMEYYTALYNPTRFDTNNSIGRGFIDHTNVTHRTTPTAVGTDPRPHGAYPGPRVPFVFSYRTVDGAHSIPFWVMVVHLDHTHYCKRDRNVFARLRSHTSWIGFVNRRGAPISSCWVISTCSQTT